MGFAPTWLRQVIPPTSHDHFNHWLDLGFRVKVVMVEVIWLNFISGLVT